MNKTKSEKISEARKRNEDVHHINGIKNDNRAENLMLISHNHHYQEVACPKCNFKFYIQ